MASAYSNSSRALAFLSETSEDALAALKGLVGGVGSAKYLDTSDNTLATIAVQIDSTRDEDRIIALTRIVAMISKGRDASQFLPAVLKLTSCSNLDVRKLVYIVLLRYANINPDLTLLSINSFQRDLSDPSPLLRAMALRVLSSIKVRMVAPVIIMAVAKASRDPNPYVRKIAALAIPKCFQIESSQLSTLLESLATLLADKSPFVLGSALSAFQQVCPERWDLLHHDYRKICHALADMDEWSQITALQVLLRYARANFVRPSDRCALVEQTGPNAISIDSSSKAKDAASVSEPRQETDGLEVFLSSDTSAVPLASSSSEPSHRSNDNATALDVDKDLQLLLSKTQNLLHSRSAAVLMGAVRLIYYLSPLSQHCLLVRPLLRILRSPSEIMYVALLNILTMAKRKRDLFAPHVTSFFLRASHEESVHVSHLKLDILVTITTQDNLPLVFAELVTHIRSPEERIAIHSISCLGHLASRRELASSSKCLAALLHLLKRRKTDTPVKDVVIARAVSVVKDLIQNGEAFDAKSSDKTAAIIYRLAALLFGTAPKASTTDPSTGDGGKKKKKAVQKVLGKGAILHPVARASILWLLGQHARKTISVSLSATEAGKEQRTLSELVLPDVLRRCAINFSNEAPIVKSHILTLSSKLFAFLPTVLMRTPGLADGEQGKSEQLMSTVTKLHFYVLKVARYDPDFDVRDRARFCKGLTNPLADVRSSRTSKADPEQFKSQPKVSLMGDESFQQIISEAARLVGEAESDLDADLKGVRLRREQVIHVLFEGKSGFSGHAVSNAKFVGKGSDSPQGLAALEDDNSVQRPLSPEIGTLSLVFGGKLLKGWLSTQLLPWTDTPTLADLREPPEITTTYPAQVSALSNTSISHLKSFSSADFVAPLTSDGPVLLTSSKTSKLAVPSSASGRATPMDLDPATPATKAQQEKYNDLDSFLDQSEEEAEDEPLDGSAPEDDDFAAHNQWEVDHDELVSESSEDNDDYDDNDNGDDDDDDDDDDDEEESSSNG